MRLSAEELEHLTPASRDRHLTAFVIAIVILHPLGLGQVTEPTVRWWAERAIWIIVPMLVLTALVAIFGRFEQANAVPEKTGS